MNEGFGSGLSSAENPVEDLRLMRLALSLGERNLGRTWPNPSVGAVLVEPRDGGPVILAQGVTQPGGRPHAETLAIAAAGERARGATLYVSLEPCSHHGRTPPCADAIVAAGIARVVTALEDPDPRVAGRGHARLRAAGLAVTTGVLTDEARGAHRGHVSRVTKGRPWVTLKLARTADGFLARREGPRLLITGEQANRCIHLLRAHADAIMVGVGTVMADDPMLTVRLPGLEERSPVRVIVDAGLNLPLQARLVATAREVPSWILANSTAATEAERALSATGAEVLRVTGEGSRIDLGDALRTLAGRGLTSVFAEGGPRLADALASDDLIDELILVTGPRPLSEEGVPALGPGLRAALAERLRLAGTQEAGPDRIEIYERVG